MPTKMTKFVRDRLPHESFEVFAERTRIAVPHATDEELRASYDKLYSDEIWINNYYQVNIDREPQHGFSGMQLIHLSIKRRDKKPIHDWRDLQAIKNELVSPEAEAIEIYPAESRLVDTANQYHLWVFIGVDYDTERRFPKVPVGWSDRSTLTSKQAKQVGAVQRDRSE